MLDLEGLPVGPLLKRLQAVPRPDAPPAGPGQYVSPSPDETVNDDQCSDVLRELQRIRQYNRTSERVAEKVDLVMPEGEADIFDVFSEAIESVCLSGGVLRLAATPLVEQTEFGVGRDRCEVIAEARVIVGRSTVDGVDGRPASGYVRG